MLGEVFKHAFKEMPFPLLGRLFPSLVKLPEKRKHCADMKRMFEDVVDQHIKSMGDELESRDFIDVYLKEMPKNPLFNYHDLIGLCIDFFEAGGETVGSTLSWFLMYLAKYPEHQEECAREIDRVLGSALPTLEDRGSLPYCEATIMEVQRLSCVAPAGLGNRMPEEVWMEGYKLPKGEKKSAYLEHL